LLASTPLAGGLPTTDEDTSTFAVYLNDGTGAKMDYYLGLGIDVASGECGVPAVPTFDVTAELSSFAPDDAATSLPIDITGGGLFGVPAGTIATNVYIYAPQGFVATSILVDGRERPFRDVVHEGRTVIALTVDLVPGQTARAVARFEGTPGASTKVLVEHTPLASPVDTTLNGYLDCAG
jgi:hypothetical protein